MGLEGCKDTQEELFSEQYLKRDREIIGQAWGIIEPLLNEGEVDESALTKMVTELSDLFCLLEPEVIRTILEAYDPKEGVFVVCEYETRTGGEVRTDKSYRELYDKFSTQPHLDEETAGYQFTPEKFKILILEQVQLVWFLTALGWSDDPIEMKPTVESVARDFYITVTTQYTDVVLRACQDLGINMDEL